MVDYNISAASSGFDQFNRRSTNREVDPSSKPRFNKSPLDDKTSSGFGGMGPDPEAKAMGLGSPTNQANKKDDDDDQDIGGVARFLNKFFGAAKESGLEFTKPDRKPKPSIYDTDSMKPIDIDAMDKRIADAVNFDLANPLPSMNFKDDEYAASTYDEVQPLEGADTYKARRITAQGINDTIKGLMDTEQRQADIKQAVNKTIESLKSADANVPYVIQAGDTLSDIAAKTGTTVQDLVKRNNIKDKNKIYTGNELIIPTDKTTKSKEDVVTNLVTGMDSGEYLKSISGKQDSSSEGVEVAGGDQSLIAQILASFGIGTNQVETTTPQFEMTLDEVKEFAKENFDPVQAAAFVATYEAETGSGRAMIEDPYGKKDAIKKFVKGNSPIMKKRKAALEKANSAEEIFNIVYGDEYRLEKYQLGNDQPGDGNKYRGRGPIMLTGKSNYKKYGEMAGVDIVNNPDLMRTDKAVAIAVTKAYLNDKGFSNVSSAEELAELVGHANPDKEGARRWNNTKKIYKDMYGEDIPESLRPKERPAGLMDNYPTSLRPKLRPENL